MSSQSAHRSTIVSAAMILLALCIAGRQDVANAAHESAFPVLVEVPFVAAPVRANDKSHLFYEVHLTNLSPAPLELTRLEIHSNAADGPVLASYASDDLTRRLLRPGLSDDVPNRRTMGGGLRAVAFVHLLLDGDVPAPTMLWHRLTFKRTDAAGHAEESVFDSGPINVTREPPIVITSALRGGDWLAANGSSDDSIHRRALITVDGKARIAQRFAIDWIKLGSGGRPHHGDPSQNTNWYGYGQDVLAVADGTVVAIEDDIPENVPLTDHRAVPITLETVAGNYVTLDVGGGHYATFGHLQPHSLRVSVGSQVHRGQVLALLGNSGNSDAPHLHFQMTDGNSTLGAEGLPFVFDSFQLQGTVPSLVGILSGRPWHPASAGVTRKQEMPLDNAVVRFP